MKVEPEARWWYRLAIAFAAVAYVVVSVVDERTAQIEVTQEARR
jgi:hypothetical protein